MQIVVLDRATLGADIDLAPLQAQGALTAWEQTAPEEVAPRLADADVVIVNKIKLNEANLKNAPRLKLICVAATGYDNIDLAYCQKRGIALCNVPGYSSDSVAQLSVAMALSLVCHLPEYREFVHSGAYSASGIANRLEPIYHNIAGMTWGVVGSGGIGGRVAAIAQAMGCTVKVCRRKAEGPYPIADIDTLCREADILSFHLPLTEETRGMLSRERIAAMKKSAIIINTARGAVADEAALAEALLQGKLGGLGCDVYAEEPFGADHPYQKILHLPNVCLTPHMAWGSAESRARCVAIMAENIRRFTAGDPQNRII